MTRRGRKVLAIVGGGLLVLAAVALVLWQRYQAAGEEAAELTAPAVAKDLPVEEIRTKLKSGNFRDKLAAKKQIEKLEPADRLAVLAALLEDADVATRLLAVSALADVGSDEARAKLGEVAAKDADEKVRAAAAEALTPPAAQVDPGAEVPTIAPGPAAGPEPGSAPPPAPALAPEGGTP